MEALLLNLKHFDLALDIIETFAKEIFSGKDDIQKLKLSERLKNLLLLNNPEKISNYVQNSEVNANAARKVKLPNEVWLKIIQYLPTQDLFGNFALSCKKFHDLSQDSSAIKYLQVKTIITWPKYENVKKIIAASKSLVEFTFNQGGRAFDNELICQALESNPSLRSLRIKTKCLNMDTINTIAKSKIEVLDLELEEKELSLDGITGLCNIKTLKSLKMNRQNQIFTILAKNSTPIEEIYFLWPGNNPIALNEFFKSKKDTLKSISLQLNRYCENMPLKNLNLCQNLEKVVMSNWHSKHLDLLSGIPNLKELVLYELDADVDTLVKFFQRLSLKKMEYLSIQFCPNAKDEFLVEMSKLDFPVLKKLTFFENWEDKLTSTSRKLTDSTLQTLVSNCPNLKRILFGDDFDNSNLTFKTIMDIFEKRNIFMFFGQTR